MDSDKQCKGCCKQVMKPITCEICGVAAHPGCISRVDHLSSGGRFVACVPTTTSPPSTDTLEQISEMIRAEFAIMKEEWRRLYKADIERINAEVLKIGNRVNELENNLRGSGSESPVVLEDVLEEIQERERRARNLILFDMEETAVLDMMGGETADKSRVKETFLTIAPGVEIIKTQRIGKSRAGHVRPLIVTLSNRYEAVTILKNKYKYKGHAKIKQDLTKQQREYLRNLRARLVTMQEAGINDKTIRYINGVPRIVDIHSKNAE